MDACKSLLVVVTVEFDVFHVLSGHLSHHIVDVAHATGASAHCLRREISVATGAIPVREELGGERDRHVEIFSNALENVTRHPKLVSHVDAKDGTDLILPLARHDLGICAGNSDASKETSTVVRISNDPTEAVVGADGAIVGTLRARVTVVRPAKRPCRELGLCANHCVLLLNTEPRLLLKTLVENFLGVYAEVSVGRLELLTSTILPFVSLSHDKDVVTLSEGITIEGDGPHDDLRVLSVSLEAGRTIVVPLGEV